MVTQAQIRKRQEEKRRRNEAKNKDIPKVKRKTRGGESGKTIVLNMPKSRKITAPEPVSKFLDVIAAPFLEPTTFIKNPLKARDKVAQRRQDIEKTGDISKVLDVVGETTTSTLIASGAILGVANPAAAAGFAKSLIPTTLKGKLAGITGLGILTTSEKAREVFGKFIQDPTKVGREAGLLIDKAAAGEDVGEVSDAFKTAGLVGAGVAAAVGLGKAAEKLKDKFFSGKPEKAINTPTDVPSSIALPGSEIPNALSPISDKPVVAETPKSAPETSQTPVNVKVINKPQINVAMAQSI